jgi:hypothetical protein
MPHIYLNNSILQGENFTAYNMETKINPNFTTQEANIKIINTSYNMCDY